MLVTVIIPVFNSSRTIIRCLESVINQTYSDIEIIVIDDGSTDDSIRLLRSYINDKNCKNITILCQKNSGPSAARNNGITHAKGEYIAFLDSDDEWYPQKIEKQMNIFRANSNLVLLGTGYSVGDTMLFHKKKLTKIGINRLIYKNYFITSTVMCPSWVFNIFTFNPTQKYSEDYLLWLQIATLKKECIVLGEVLTKMSDKPLFGSTGLSSNLWQMEKGELLNIYRLYNENNIKLYQFISAVVFSMIKFFRRLFIIKIKKMLCRKKFF